MAWENSSIPGLHFGILLWHCRKSQLSFVSFGLGIKLSSLDLSDSFGREGGLGAVPADVKRGALAFPLARLSDVSDCHIYLPPLVNVTMWSPGFSALHYVITMSRIHTWPRQTRRSPRMVPITCNTLRSVNILVPLYMPPAWPS